MYGTDKRTGKTRNAARHSRITTLRLRLHSATTQNY